MSRSQVSVSVHPPRLGAVEITRDTGHHSRLCKGLYSSPALHALLAPRLVPVGMTCAGTIDPGSKGCASHTSEGDPIHGDQAGAAQVGPGQRVAGAVHDRAVRVGLKAHRGNSKVWPSIRASLGCVTRPSVAVDEAPDGATSVVTVSAAASNDAGCPARRRGSDRRKSGLRRRIRECRHPRATGIAPVPHWRAVALRARVQEAKGFALIASVGQRTSRALNSPSRIDPAQLRWAGATHCGTCRNTLRLANYAPTFTARASFG